MREKVISYSFFFTGLMLFGLGNATAVQVKYLGLHPWEVLHVALFQRYGLSIGTWSTLVGLLFVGLSWVLNRKYINIGTLLNALMIGPFTDFFLWSGILPKATHTPLDYLILGSAMVITGTAGGLYVAGSVGAGPRDSFMLSVAEKTKLSVSRARIVVELAVLALGFLLGGPAFVASFIYTLIISPIFQYMLGFFRKLRLRLIGPQPVQI